jgi:hypothetical protein
MVHDLNPRELRSRYNNGTRGVSFPRIFTWLVNLGQILRGDYGTGGHVRDSVCKGIAGLRRG